jgi:hypothetical protein
LDSILSCMAFISASRHASVCSIFVLWRYSYLPRSLIQQFDQSNPTSDTSCHVYLCDYRRVLDWWLDLLYSLIQCVTTLYSSPLHTHTHTHTHTSVHSHVFTRHCSVASSTADIPLSLGSRTIPGLSYQFLTATAPTQQLNLSSSLANSLTELTNCPAYNILAQTTKKTPFLCCSLLSSSYLFCGRCLGMGLHDTVLMIG